MCCNTLVSAPPPPPRWIQLTVTITHKDTPADMLKQCVSMADILVVCAGKPALITKEMVKPGAVVVDVGINRITCEYGGMPC